MNKADAWFDNMITRPPTMKQIDYLAKLGYTGDRPKTLQEASKLIDSLKRRTDDEDDMGFIDSCGDFDDGANDWLWR